MVHEGGKVVSSMHWSPLPQSHSAAGMSKSMNNPNDPIENSTCSLLACSTMPQPTVPPYTANTPPHCKLPKPTSLPKHIGVEEAPSFPNTLGGTKSPLKGSFVLFAY